MVRPFTSLEERYWSKVVKHDGCWEWTAGTRQNGGYGVIATPGKSVARGGTGRQLVAHRLSWEIHNGPIPENLLVLHRCDNPPCTNPEHLYLGTQKDNVRDMDERVLDEPQHLP